MDAVDSPSRDQRALFGPPWRPRSRTASGVVRRLGMRIAADSTGFVVRVKP